MGRGERIHIVRRRAGNPKKMGEKPKDQSIVGEKSIDLTKHQSVFHSIFAKSISFLLDFVRV